MGKETIAIVGGGASGALTGFHLSLLPTRAQVILVDPASRPGLGLAYSTPSMRHLLNVPAGKISALPSEPDHFLRWLRTHHDAAANEWTFAPRAVFGRYIQGMLAECKGLRHIAASVIRITLHGGQATLCLSNGEFFAADRVVLATGNFDPAQLPGIAPEAVASGLYFQNAWRPEACTLLASGTTVALIGTGLTAIDVLLRLRENGHHGMVAALSRHGVFPTRHEPYTAAPRSVIPAGTAPTCVGYLRTLRRALKTGMQWRAAIDSLRGVTNELWLALPLVEQKRFRRHLQRRWDVVRHRMAPAIADTFAAEIEAGTLVVYTGSLRSVTAGPQGARIAMRSLHGDRNLYAARVINCTGPDMRYARVESPLLQSLFAQGIAAPGPLGGGFATSPDGALLDAQGEPSAILFTLGPSRQGTLLESIAIPEIRQQAFDLACLLAGMPALAGQGAAA